MKSSEITGIPILYQLKGLSIQKQSSLFYQFYNKSRTKKQALPTTPNVLLSLLGSLGPELH